MIHVFFSIGSGAGAHWQEVPSDSIIGLTQRCEPFGENFSLRLTPCKVFELSALKSAFANASWQALDSVYYVKLEEDDTGSNVVYATLHVDSRDDTNETYYKWTLMDAMVLLNEELD